MVRFLVCPAILILSAGFASADTAHVYCSFEETQGLVICIRGNEARPVFRYEVHNPDVGSLTGLSSDGKEPSNANKEQCRINAENFRRDDLESKLNSSLEGLRAQAEVIRAASESNLAVYKQIMVVYDALFERYKAGVQAYQNALKACRVTPYDVRPDRV